MMGRIHPSGDLDHFKLEQEGERGFDLEITQDPFLRVGVEVQDPAGGTVLALDPGQVSSRTIRKSLTGAPGTYRLRVTQPPNSIMMIFDSSGSMEPAYAQIEAAAAHFIDSLSGLEEVSTCLIAADGVRVLSDFTRDREALKAATLPAISQGGSSNATAALESALQKLAQRRGNRAIVIMSDFQENGNPTGLWSWAQKTGAQIYTVGYAITFGSQWRAEIGNSQLQYMENLAMATGGRCLYAPSGDALVDLYKTIADDLSTSPPYTISVLPPSLPGRLQVRFANREVARKLGSERRILLILDASGSMNHPVKGSRQSKIDVAKRVIRHLLDELPDGTRLGLRIYGRRYSPKDRRTCQDMERLVPIAPLRREKFKQIVDSIRPRGETPMIASVIEGARDFEPGGVGKKTIVLISDGLETCGGSPEQVKALRGQGVDLVDVNVLGFDIQDPAATAQLENIARFGGGQYYDARDPEGLDRALVETVQIGFIVASKRGEIIAEGRVGGDPLTLPVGHYAIHVDTTPPYGITDFPIQSDELTKITINE